MKIPYGYEHLCFTPPPDIKIDTYVPKERQKINKPITISDLKAILDKENPELVERVGRFDHPPKVAITANDPTRPIPNHIILPALLDFLNKAGVKKEDITLYIATGTHKDLNPQELSQHLTHGIYDEYRTHVHDCHNAENLTYLDQSEIGTPIYINSQFYKSDIKIVTGQIEPHHFMGYSGGVKPAVIGLGGIETIEQNHSLIKDPKAIMGVYDANPMRMDVEDIGRRLEIDLALNVILDDDKNILKALFGDPQEVMRAGIGFSKEICATMINKKYDLAIASPGGYPKDINLYQSQKAITHACNFVKSGGVVILCAECREGLGNDKFEKYFSGKNNPDDVIMSFEDTKFKIGPQKAYQLAIQQKRFRIIMVSSLDPDVVRSAFIQPAQSLDEAFSMASSYLPEGFELVILPYATHMMAEYSER